MRQAEWMDQFVYDLIEHYEAELLASGLIYLELRMDGHGVLTVEEKIKHKQMCVCYWLYDVQHHPVPEPQILFYLDEGSHWIPYEICRHTAGQRAYATLNEAATELMVTDIANQAALAEYTDTWAEFLRAQDWVDGAEKSITQTKQWLDDDDAPLLPPTLEELWRWVDEDGKCQATDGCWCEPDGTCEHGHQSWLLEWGLI